MREYLSLLPLFVAGFLMVWVGLVLSSAGEDRAGKDSPVLTFGVYTSDKPSTMYQKFKPALNALENRMAENGRRRAIKLKIYPTYRTAITAIARGDCDFVRMGPASYILSKVKNPRLRLLAMEKHSGENPKRFSGVFVTQRDSDIQSIKDLRGRTFAFGNRNSTIGRYLSQAELVRAGIHASDLESFKYFKRHDQVAALVANGNYDAGVVKENTFRKFRDRLKEISRFDNVTKPWVARAGLDEEDFAALKRSLLGLEDAEALRALGQPGFLEAEDGDYDFVRRGMKISEEFGDE